LAGTHSDVNGPGLAPAVPQISEGARAKVNCVQTGAAASFSSFSGNGSFNQISVVDRNALWNSIGSVASRTNSSYHSRWNREPSCRNAVCFTRGQFRPCCDGTL